MVIGIFLVSLVSAGLVDYLSNVVSGSVSVEGPVFYLDGTRDSQYDKYYTLKLDDNILATNFTIEGDVSNQWFVSDVLGIDNFYDEQYKIYLRLKTIAESETSSVFAELWISDEENDLKERVCSTPIYVGISEEDVYEFDCVPGDGGGMKNMETSDKLILAVRSSPIDVQTKLYTLNSKIEVTAK